VEFGGGNNVSRWTVVDRGKAEEDDYILHRCFSTKSVLLSPRSHEDLHLGLQKCESERMIVAKQNLPYHETGTSFPGPIK
jgi:hypothetical protein